MLVSEWACQTPPGAPAGRGFEFEPVAFDVELGDRAHSNATDIVQTSYHPVPIDDEDADAFFRRWGFLLAEAVAGRLKNVHRGLPTG